MRPLNSALKTTSKRRRLLWINGNIKNDGHLVLMKCMLRKKWVKMDGNYAPFGFSFFILSVVYQIDIKTYLT
jgi:hypothetical protein